MVVGTVAFGAYVFLGNPQAPGKTFLEADANGRMRQVARPSVAESPRPKLWKPEPQFILNQGKVLNLNKVQVQQIQQVLDSWQTTKAALETDINAETAFLSGPASGRKSLTGIQTDLGTYTELSRRFGIERASSWSQAVEVLTPSQREELDRMIAKEIAQ